MAKYTKHAVVKTLYVAGSSFVTGAKEDNNDVSRLRGSGRDLYFQNVVPPPTPYPVSNINSGWVHDGFVDTPPPTPYPVSNINNGWLHDGFDRIDTPQPTPWEGDAYEPPVSNINNGWTGDAHASVSGGTLHYDVNGGTYVTKGFGFSGVHVSESSIGVSVSGSTSVSGGKSGKGSSNSGSSSGKSGKGSSIGVSVSGSTSGGGGGSGGGKSGKGSSSSGSSSGKSGKGSSIGVSVSGSTSVSGGKSGKGSSSSGSSSGKSGKESSSSGSSSGKSGKGSSSDDSDECDPPSGKSSKGSGPSGPPPPLNIINIKPVAQPTVSVSISGSGSHGISVSGSASVTGGKSGKGSSSSGSSSGKSGKGSSSFGVNVSGSVSHGVVVSGSSSVNIIPAAEPTVQATRGKWADDGWTAAIVTPEPTPRPTWKGDAFVTPAPTPCEDMVFFYYGNACTNDIYIADATSYVTPMACCSVHVGLGSYADGTCNVIDVCNSLTTPNPTPKPTPKPVTPAPTRCDEMVFFYDGDKCANDMYIADATSYATLEACCNMNFYEGALTHGECYYIDVCNPEPISPPPTPCEDMKFFLDGDTCTNDIYIADGTAYDTAMICCNANYGAGSYVNGGCNVIDICSPPQPTPKPTPNPTPNPTPYPTPKPSTPAPTRCEDIVFFYYGNKCANDIYIAGDVSYSTAIACCNAHFGVGSLGDDECIYVDICNPEPVVTPVPTYSPTAESSFGSTPTVSKETTGPPTMITGRLRSGFMTDETTECREIIAGYPAVCVKVCTTIKSVFNGSTLVDESATTTESECD